MAAAADDADCPYAQQPAQKAGVYSSTCGANWVDFWQANPNPDFAWAAEYKSPPQPSTNALSSPSDCGSPGGFTQNMWDTARHKQFRQNVTLTENGVTLQVDINCARGPAYGTADTPIRRRRMNVDSRRHIPIATRATLRRCAAASAAAAHREPAQQLMQPSGLLVAMYHRGEPRQP